MSKTASWKRFTFHTMRLPSGMFREESRFGSASKSKKNSDGAMDYAEGFHQNQLDDGVDQVDSEEVAKGKIAILLFQGNLDLLATICKINQFGDGNAVATPMMLFLRRNGSAESFITRMLSTRISTSALTESRDLTNVLRDNSMTVSLLTTFAKLEGTNYLKEVLTDPTSKVMDLARKVEINPEALSRGADGTFLFFVENFKLRMYLPALIVSVEARENLENLVRAVDIILDQIYESRKSLPGSFRRICHHIKKESSRKLAEVGVPEESIDPCSLRLVGSFIFLRFFCPALSAPQNYSLTTRTTFSPEERRGMILIAKIFISLGADTDLAAKEDYMIPLNLRLVSHKEKVKEYLTFASSPVPPRESVALRKDPEQFEKAITSVVAFLVKNMDKIQDLVTPDQEELTAELVKLQDLLNQLELSPTTPSPTPSPTLSQSSPSLASPSLSSPTESSSRKAEKKRLAKTYTDLSELPSTPISPTTPKDPSNGARIVGAMRSMLRKPKHRTTSLDNLDIVG